MPALPANPLSQQADHNGSIGAGAQDSEPAQGEAQPVGGSGEVEAAAARRFAIQQEQLAAAQERGRRLEAQLRQQRELVQEQEGELSRLRAQLGSTAGPQQAEATPLARQEVVSSRPCSQRSPLAGSQLQGGGVGEGSSAWLRLKWLESRASLERCTASNGRLLRELEGARQQVQALQQEMSWREEQLEEAWEQSRQQDPHHGLQALGRLGPTVVRQAQEAGRTGWPLEACPANGSHLDPNTREQGILSAQSAGLPAAPAAAVLQLKQQLAEANYRASRLRIELDAAEAKLAAIQGSSGGQGRQHTSHSLQQQQLQHGAPSTQTQAHAVPRCRAPPLRTLQPRRHGQPVWQSGVHQEDGRCRSAGSSPLGTNAGSVAPQGWAEPAEGPHPEAWCREDNAGQSRARRRQDEMRGAIRCRGQGA